MTTPNPGSPEAIEQGCIHWETFKDIPMFEGLYQVSDEGRVKSLRHFGCAGKVGFLTPRWRKRTARNNGRYASVRLIDKTRGLDVQFLIHRLVARCFLGEPPPLHEVNHIDGNTENNKLENLEWVTRSENQKHAIRIGLAKRPTGHNVLDSGKQYKWINKDGRTFAGPIATLVRQFPSERLSIAYMHKIAIGAYGHKSFKGWGL